MSTTYYLGSIKMFLMGFSLASILAYFYCRFFVIPFIEKSKDSWVWYGYNRAMDDVKVIRKYRNNGDNNETCNHATSVTSKPITSISPERD